MEGFSEERAASGAGFACIINLLALSPSPTFPLTLRVTHQLRTVLLRPYLASTPGGCSHSGELRRFGRPSPDQTGRLAGLVTCHEEPTLPRAAVSLYCTECCLVALLVARNLQQWFLSIIRGPSENLAQMGRMKETAPLLNRGRMIPGRRPPCSVSGVQPWRHQAPRPVMDRSETAWSRKGQRKTIFYEAMDESHRGLLTGCEGPDHDRDVRLVAREKMREVKEDGEGDAASEGDDGESEAAATAEMGTARAVVDREDGRSDQVESGYEIRGWW